MNRHKRLAAEIAFELEGGLTDAQLARKLEKWELEIVFRCLQECREVEAKYMSKDDDPHRSTAVGASMVERRIKALFDEDDGYAPATTLRYVAEEGCEPTYGNDRAAGIDLRVSEHVLVPAAKRTTIHYIKEAPAHEEIKAGIAKVGSGLRVEIPPGHVGLIRGRSSLAFNRGIWSFEGTIDEDYRGEISLLLLNQTGNDVAIEKGTRVAQLVVVPVARPGLQKVEKLGETERGEKGFGSTGQR